MNFLNGFIAGIATIIIIIGIINSYIEYLDKKGNT